MGFRSRFFTKRHSPHDPVNLVSREFKANPYPFYARLRVDAPVYRITRPEPAWLITRYDDVATVLKDDRFAKDTANALTPEQLAQQRWFRKLKLFKALQRNMLDRDPPDHTRLRALVNKAFTPRLIDQLRPRIQTLTNELLDHVQDRGRMDLIRDYALPLPATIIAEMLGVPVEDRDRFHRWSNAMIVASTWGLLKAIPNAWSFLRYLRKLVQQRRVHPQEDLVSALVRSEAAGDTLSEEELVAMYALTARTCRKRGENRMQD